MNSNSNISTLFAGYTPSMVRRICGKCELLADRDDGQFNLLVKDVRLGRDERYECQVLPGPQAAMKVPLRASVQITIQGECKLGPRFLMFARFARPRRMFAPAESRSKVYNCVCAIQEQPTDHLDRTARSLSKDDSSI